MLRLSDCDHEWMSLNAIVLELLQWFASRGKHFVQHFACGVRGTGHRGTAVVNQIVATADGCRAAATRAG
jgi:hypothetical protein